MMESTLEQRRSQGKGHHSGPWVCTVVALVLAGCVSGPSKRLVSEEPPRADELAAEERQDPDGEARKRYRPELAKSAVYHGGNAVP